MSRPSGDVVTAVFMHEQTPVDLRVPAQELPRAISHVLSANLGDSDPGATRRELREPVTSSPGGRWIVVGDDRFLAAVIGALLRADRIDEVELAWVSPTRQIASRIYRIAHGPAGWRDALELQAQATPLIRDDLSNALVSRALITGVGGGTFDGETYVDSHRLASGAAIGPVLIEPTLALPGVRARELVSRWIPRARRWHSGRAVQTGGVGFTVTRDGVLSPRELVRSTFYRDHRALRLVRR